LIIGLSLRSSETRMHDGHEGNENDESRGFEV
jgi:hypothetical protein